MQSSVSLTWVSAGTLVLLLAGCWSKPTGESSVSVSEASTGDVVFPPNFLFGVATAPAHAEDELQDIWLDFAKDQDKKGVKAWHNAGHPELRLKFWTDYKTEIDLASATGSKIFRMGVDWGRLAPRPPRNTCPGSMEPCYEGVQDLKALEHYQKIVRYARKKGLSVMMTLFHHSAPKWLVTDVIDEKCKENQGGWTNRDAIPYFKAFATDVVKALRGDVDLWVIFNEPAVFSALSYGSGIWPPAKGMNYFAMFKVGSFEGSVAKSNENMIVAHRAVYKVIKDLDQVATGDRATATFGPASVGIAHNVGYMTGRGPLGVAMASYMKSAMNYSFLDGVIDHLDFLGLNYYGEEVISGAGVPPVADREYSESGRAVSPIGFYLTLKDISQRYLKGRAPRKIPIWITENGISDGTDVLRRPYLAEHLAAMKAAMDDGVPIVGYIFWTISDNWEWADGYCPKFGLYEVDRSSKALRRIPRPSAKLFTKIVKDHRLLHSDRREAWEALKAQFGKPRPFCRSADGLNSLDQPEDRPVVPMDWRFVKPNQ